MGATSDGFNSNHTIYAGILVRFYAAHIIVAWILTLPASALVAALTYWARTAFW
jgi:phosphate/sulfate permease